VKLLQIVVKCGHLKKEETMVWWVLSGVALLIFYFRVPWNPEEPPTARDMAVGIVLFLLLCLGIALVATGIVAGFLI